MFVTATSVAAMLVMVSATEDKMDLARTAYSNCVVENAIVFLDRKADQGEYAKSMPLVCQAEKTSYSDAVLAYEKAEGSTAAEAKQYAKDEVQMVLDDSLEEYAEHLVKGTRPEKEA